MSRQAQARFGTADRRLKAHCKPCGDLLSLGENATLPERYLTSTSLSLTVTSPSSGVEGVREAQPPEKTASTGPACLKERIARCLDHESQPCMPCFWFLRQTPGELTIPVLTSNSQIKVGKPLQYR